MLKQDPTEDSGLAPSGACADKEEDVVAAMSALNMEMANMTRELHKKNMQLAVSQQALARADSMKKTFLAIIAHDLRGHIGGISNALSMLEEDYEGMDESDKREFVSLAADQARKTFLLLEDLLTWSRSQLDQLGFHPVPTNIRRLVEENIGLLKSRAEEKDITLTHEIPDTVTASLDTGMIGTVLRNLLSNALKFTPPGGSILVTAVADEQDVKITVRDTGKGMTKETVENLFRIDSKLVSTEGTAGETGSGLGLILCKEFVEKHEGRIWAESAPGGGSAFTFSLPARV